MTRRSTKPCAPAAAAARRAVPDTRQPCAETLPGEGGGPSHVAEAVKQSVLPSETHSISHTYLHGETAPAPSVS